jgi:hypothetical protein
MIWFFFFLLFFFFFFGCYHAWVEELGSRAFVFGKFERPLGVGCLFIFIGMYCVYQKRSRMLTQHIGTVRVHGTEDWTVSSGPARCTVRKWGERIRPLYSTPNTDK